MEKIEDRMENTECENKEDRIKKVEDGMKNLELRCE
jgi:hypothetical protein